MKIAINKDSEIPIRDQLIEQIGLQIASGALKGKDKLPSIRALADRLGIHYSTVTAAYNHLGDAGLLEVRQGSGVRVAGRAPTEDSKQTLDELVREFLAKAVDSGVTRDELRKRLDVVITPKPIRRVVAVDRNVDFHEILLKELRPNFKVPVESMTVEEFNAGQNIDSDALIVTSLYHLHAFENNVSDPTRLVVCNVEPAHTALDAVLPLPAGALVALISVSPTIMRMATKLLASLRNDIGVRSEHVSESTEIEYLMKHADLVLCDISSEEALKPFATKKKISTFRLYSPSTIQSIQERLANWA